MRTCAAGVPGMHQGICYMSQGGYRADTGLIQGGYMADTGWVQSCKRLLMFSNVVVGGGGGGGGLPLMGSIKDQLMHQAASIHPHPHTPTHIHTPTSNHPPICISIHSFAHMSTNPQIHPPTRQPVKLMLIG